MSKKQPTNKELLIRLDVKVDYLTTKICNHLAHHFKVNIVLLGAALSAIGGLIVALVY